MKPELIADRTGMMQRLSDQERAAAIASAENVIGFGRFTQHRRQVELRSGYRAPTKR